MYLLQVPHSNIAAAGPTPVVRKKATGFLVVSIPSRDKTRRDLVRWKAVYSRAAQLLLRSMTFSFSS